MKVILILIKKSRHVGCALGPSSVSPQYNLLSFYSVGGTLFDL